MPGPGGLGHAAVDGFDGLVRLDEKLQLHLLELARAEGVIARRNLVPERLAHLRDAERHFLAGRFQHVLELGEDRLRRLGAEVGDVALVGDRTDVSFEHQVEGAWGCKQRTVLGVEAL